MEDHEPRRLALVVAPGEGESLRSWLDRMAVRNRCSAGVMAGLLALPMGGRDLSRPSIRPLAFGIVSTPVGRAAIEAATGVGAEVVRAMHLEAFDGTALDLRDVVVGDEVGVGRVAMREWALFYATRACPPCLSESGGVWLTWWKLGCAAACPRHAVMLIDACPACGMPLRRGHKGRTYRPSLSQAAEALMCLAPLGRGVQCRLDVSAVAAPPAPEGLVAAQQRLLEFAAGASGRVGGREVTAREFFAALRLVAVLVRLGQPRTLEVFAPAPAQVHPAMRAEGQVRSLSRGGPTTSAKVPASAWAAAGLAAVCLPVLEASSEVELAERLGAVVAAAGVGRWGSRLDNVRSGTEPEVLTWAIRQVRFPPASKMVRWARPRAGWALEARHLPRLPPRESFRELIAPLMPVGAGPLRWQRFTAIAAARRALELRTWAQAGAVCGLDGGLAVATAGHCGGALRDRRVFWDAIDTLLDRLVAAGPVDFAARREHLADLRTIPEPAWRAILRGSGMAVTPRRACNAAAWLWAELTCGCWRDAPAAVNPTHGADVGRECRIASFKVFTDWLPPLVEARLRAYGQQLLDGAGPS